MAELRAINITQWLEENKHSFVPPVCNKLMYVQFYGDMLYGPVNLMC